MTQENRYSDNPMHYSIYTKLNEILVEREQEIEAVKLQFGVVLGGQTAIAVIEGVAGCGKTTLINVAMMELSKLNGTSAYCKFEQPRSEEPYVGIIQIVENITDHILTLPEKEYKLIKNRLTKELGKDVSLITDIIPNVQRIIGQKVDTKSKTNINANVSANTKTNPNPNTNTSINTNINININTNININININNDNQKLNGRMEEAFLTFISITAKEMHPLIIAFDDLQWADKPSWNIISLIADQMCEGGLYIILSYRSNLEEYRTKVNSMLDSLGNSKSQILKIVLESPIDNKVESLSQVSTNEFMMYSLLRVQRLVLNGKLEDAYCLVQRTIEYLDSVKDSVTEVDTTIREERLTVDDNKDTIIEYQNEMEKLNLEEAYTFFLNAICEETGASFGVILLEDNDSIKLKYLREEVKPAVRLPTGIDIECCDKLPKRVIRYTARTNRGIVIESTSVEGLFANDEYFKDRVGVSAICIPLKYNVIFIGIVYLERPRQFSSLIAEYIKNRSVYLVAKHVLENQSGIIKNRVFHNGSIEDNLTKREMEVLSYMALGMSNNEIAEKLRISSSTVKTHTLHLYGKLEVNSRLQAVTKAKAMELI